MGDFFWGVGTTLVLLGIGAGWVEYRAGEYQRMAANRIDRFLANAESRIADEVARRVENKIEDELSGRAAQRRSAAS